MKSKFTITQSSSRNKGPLNVQGHRKSSDFGQEAEDRVVCGPRAVAFSRVCGKGKARLNTLLE